MDKLKIQTDNSIEEKQERYQFTWPNKTKTISSLDVPSESLLRPCREESVDFDNTKHLYIEGDNIEVLKLLQHNYEGQVKVIYIDPPYNTGNDFIYKDKYISNSREYVSDSRQFGEEQDREILNAEIDGRYHTDWLNMMYPRLKLARNLLSDSGAIFISIDDNELDKLKMICDEIFGSQNFVAIFTWMKTTNPPSLGSKVRDNMEYILCYEKCFSSSQKLYGRESNQKDSPLANATNKINTVTIPSGTCSFGNLKDGIVEKGNKKSGVDLLDDINVANGINANDFRITFRSKWGQENIHNEVSKGTTFIIKDSEYFSIRYIKGNIDYVVPDKYLDYNKFNVRDNEYGRKELEELMGKVGFNYPKNTPLISTLIKMYTKNSTDDIIMDFFSGSGTTAHSVLNLNAEDKANRKYIMVQLPEPTKDNSIPKKKGYDNICEIGKERIRRAAQKIRENYPTESLDMGFRVLKVDNLKEDITPEDLLFQAMLEFGVMLSESITVKEISHKKVYCVGDGDLLACFEEGISKDILKEVAKEKPRYAVFRKCDTINDDVAINCEQIFKKYSPETMIKRFC